MSSVGLKLKSEGFAHYAIEQMLADGLVLRM